MKISNKMNTLRDNLTGIEEVTNWLADFDAIIKEVEALEVEPSEAEVEAVARAIWAWDVVSNVVWEDEPVKHMYRNFAKAAISAMKAHRPAATPEIIGIDLAVPGSDKTAYAIYLTPEEVGKIEGALTRIIQSVTWVDTDFGEGGIPLMDEEAIERAATEALSILAKLKGGV